MHDTTLYEQILGLRAPWSVKSVTLKKDEGVIEVEVVCEETLWGCPECNKRMHAHGNERRRWRHLDSCQYKTILIADVPRVKCEEHGSQMVRVPWAEKHGRFTAMFERLTIDLLQDCSVSAACGILRISWDEADGIKQRAVDRGLLRRNACQPKRLCIDEKSVGWGHQYVTIVSCADTVPARVLAIEDGREEASLDRFWNSLSDEGLAQVQTVAMDMWEPFRNSTLRHVPEAHSKIVYDSFHLARYMNRAVDEVRRSERAYMSASDDVLKGTRQLWLYGLENVPPKWASRFKALRELATKTAKAWKVKELLRSFWRCSDEGDALAFFRMWRREAMATRLAPVKKVVRLFDKHWANIVTYFRHHLSNAASEGLNSRIQQLIQKACGI
jgi:transposase